MTTPVDSVLMAIRHALGRASRSTPDRQLSESLPPAGAESVANAADVQQPGADAEPVPRYDGPPSPISSGPSRAGALESIRRRQYGRAQRELEQVLRLDPGSGAEDDLRTLRGVRRYQRLIDSQPSNALAHLELGRCYLELDLAPEAMAELQEAARLAPDLAEPHVIMAVEHLYSSRTAEAQEEYEHALSIDPSLPPFSELEDSLRRERIALDGASQVAST